MVDRVFGCYGCYVCLDPPHALILNHVTNKIGIVMHELTHHLEYYDYKDHDNKPFHAYEYQLAKQRVFRWCKKNISSKPNWNIPLNAISSRVEMIAFKL